MAVTISNALRRPVAALSSFSSTFRFLQPLTAIRTFRPLRPADRVIDSAGSDAPAYPYGPRQTFKQADRGLYGGATKQFGNKISKGRNKGKTRRSWMPNVRLETIRSEALNQDLTIRITASCLRTIKKCGGLDQYLLGDKPARMKELGLFGWQLRWKVMNSPMMRLKFAEERRNLGLPPRSNTESLKEFEEVWSDETLRAEMLREQKEAWETLKEKDDKFMEHVKTTWLPKDDDKNAERSTLGKKLHPIIRDPNLLPTFAKL